jgi:hypothetical protein
MKTLLVDLTLGDAHLSIIMGIALLALGISSFKVVDDATRQRMFPLPMAVGITLFGLFQFAWLGIVKPRLDTQSPYTVVAQGTYENATHSTTGGLISQPFTVIHFTDGRTFTLPGQQDIPFSKGTPLVIQKNKRYLKVESR